MIGLWISASYELNRQARVYRNIFRMVDSIREMRAMVLVALPFPPLPVEVGKVAGDGLVVEGVTVTTTHDLLAQCMNACALRDDVKVNKERRERQVGVLRGFLADLCERGVGLDGSDLYDLYCQHSYRHLCTYFKEDDRPEVRFLPYSYIAKGDKCHKKLLEHFVAQGVLFQEKHTDELAKRAEKYSVGRVLCLMRERLLVPVDADSDSVCQEPARSESGLTEPARHEPGRDEPARKNKV